MDILKYFYEEPAALEVLTPDLDADARRQASPAPSLEAFLSRPAAYRGYLAGTDLTRGRVGATALAQPDAFIVPLLDVFAGRTWQAATAEGHAETISEPDLCRRLAEPGPTAVLAGATAPLPPDALTTLAQVERRRGLAVLGHLLNQGAVVLFPEPAHHGHDWSLYAATPLREPLVAAFRRDPRPGVRRFVIPYRRAQSEHKFYFEQWQLDDGRPDYIEEL